MKPRQLSILWLHRGPALSTFAMHLYVAVPHIAVWSRILLADSGPLLFSLATPAELGGKE